ncbi:hypothetical protein BDZ94DRAFT_1274293 [Collybia nuda]|uniref:F-box domain-containing protein n=1 Tax=Collybia nuda TaxID=64659 RepID=A0A9P5XUJ6_9AGAR|nr:hypothetical protein BDZ94DRAFT_1274293 [Collybia nuda]
MSPVDYKNPAIHNIPHNALRVEDIVDQILLKLMENDQPKKSDLLSMARCCRAFEDPSLNRLWASMNSVVPLLKLIDGVEVSQGTLIIGGKLEYVELSSRFHSYAKRIRSLDYDMTTNFANVDVSTWIRLAQLEGALLPNLKSLKISCTIVHGATSAVERDKALLLLPVVARPSPINSFTFQMLSVTSHNTRYEVGPFLSILSDYKLSIETLVLSGTFTPQYTKTIAMMKSLRSVSLQLALDSTLPAVLAALASLPRLHTVELDFTGLTPSPAEIGTHSFQSLLKVALSGSISFISRTLSSIICPGMECVHARLIIMNAHGATDVPPAQESVLPYLQLSRFPTLKYIVLDLSGCASPSSDGQRENRLNLVASILGNRGVEEFTVTSLGPHMCLSDHEINEIATAWPSLRVLKFEHTWAPFEQPSFTSLDHLAKRCPQLTEVSMTLREGDIQDLNHSDTPSPGKGVWKLSLQHTMVKRYAVVGRYIDELFPFLNKFTMNETQGCGYLQDVIFQACQVVRKSEQRRKKGEDTKDSQLYRR